jgi:ubiquinone/menaquinone biosynthesis C-methylase UbiE
MYKSLFILALLFTFFINKLQAQHGCKESYFNTKKRVEKLKPLFQFMEIKEGDTIASIGAKNGWFEAAISVYYDKLTFYLEDLSDNCLNTNVLDKTIAQYSKIKNKKIENAFIPHIGTDSSTLLPKGIFAKVLISNTYHHFEKKKEMLSDIYSITKPEGMIYVFEPIVFPNQVKNFKCQYYTSKEVLIG